jgi:hypothetical protein
VDYKVYVRTPFPHNMLFKELVIQNWGDRSVVDDTDKGWSERLNKNEVFRKQFMRGITRLLEERRAEPMDVWSYWVVGFGGFRLVWIVEVRWDR